MTNFDELIDEVEYYTREVANNTEWGMSTTGVKQCLSDARTALLSAILEVETERDNLKTVLHGNQDADYDKQLQIETLKSQLAEAEADADRLANAGWNPPEYTENYGDVVCRFCEQGGYAIPIVHKPDCPWVLHQKRKEGK